MRGYDRDESGQSLKEYDDYEDEEVEGEEYGEEEEEEDPKPSKEALEFLGLRQRLKEEIPKQKKEGDSSLANSSDKKKKLPYNNFGSFFGSSQPVISSRVIQESKSFLETQHLASRVLNSMHHNKNSSGSTSAGSKPVTFSQKPRVINEVKNDVIKYTRDYSFLSSDVAAAPAPAKDPSNVSVRSSEVQSSQMATKSKLPLENNGRPLHGGRDKRKPVSINGYMHSKVGADMSSSASRRPDSKSVDSSKQLGSNNGNGTGQPSGPKGFPSKMPASTTERKPSAPVVKNSLSGVCKPLPLKSQSSISKQQLRQRKEVRELNKPKVLSRPSAGLKKPQVNKQQMQRKISSGPILHEQRLKRNPVRPHPDDEYDDEAFRELRKVLGRRPSRYDDDDDDSDMEANFHDIMMEERESERIGREEDEREARLLEVEERKKRMLKKRKLAH